MECGSAVAIVLMLHRKEYQGMDQDMLGRYYFFRLALECFGLPPEQLEWISGSKEMAEDRISLLF